MWDTSIGLQGSVALTPVKVFREHTLEVNSVCWSCPRGCPQQVLSASWDSTVKLWDVDAGSVSLRTFRSHNGPAYSAKWSPHLPGVFASVGGTWCFVCTCTCSHLKDVGMVGTCLFILLEECAWSTVCD